MLNTLCKLLIAFVIGASLYGCASEMEKPAVVEAPPPPTETVQTPSRSSSDLLKIMDLERQLARERRQCVADKRRLDLSLKESQKQSEELQKKLDDLQNKLDGLLNIDRELRSRGRNR